jgi:hypothetical protein
MIRRTVSASPLTMRFCPLLLLVLLAVGAPASAQNQKKTSAPTATPSHQSNPAPTAQRAAPAPHAAPAPRPSGGHSGAQQPQKPSSANANKGGATGTNKAAPANANRGNPPATNKAAPATSNRSNPPATNKAAPATANRSNPPAANKGAPTQANKGTTGGNKTAPANANKGNPSGPNKSAPTHANKGTTGGNKTSPANANKGNPSGPNKSAPTHANKGTTGGNKTAPANAHKGNPASPNKGAPANAHKGTPGGNKTAPANAHKGNPSGANKTLPANAHRGNPAGPNKGGSRYQPAGSKTVVLKQGGTAVYRGNGQVRTIQTHGMTINRGMHGSTRIVSTRHGTTVVSYGRGVGYSQRSYYSHGGRVYVQRTYYSGGRYYAYGYRSYTWGGRPYYGYAPPYYWGPRYYGWAYNPWPAPVYYSWGWGPAPWYGYYGPYFAPYPVYPTAAFWLTDYLIAANLQAAYAAQLAAQSRDAGPEPLTADSASEIASLWTTDPLIAANLVPADMAYMLGEQAQAATGNATQLSPEVKQAISDEMKNEIAAEQAAAASGKKDTPSTDQIPAALDPKIRIFVVSSDEDLTTSDGVECALTPGDVVYRTGDKPDEDNMVDATVKSSKKDECAVGATVGVDTGDLQEMHNQLRIQMDAGLKELADKQGKDGIPAAPDTKTQAGEVPPPKPDESVGTELQEQQKEAAQAEAQLPN